MNINTIQVASKAFIITSLLFFSGCVNHQPELSQLQLEQLQTKYYDANKTNVFSATISMIQSEGLMIKSIDKDLGVVFANGNSKFEGIDMFTFSGGIKSSTMQIMITVKEVKKNKTKVRMSINKEITGKTAFGGGSTSEFIIQEPIIYTTLFNKIDKYLFIESATE